MENTNISSLMETTMSKIRDMVDVNTVVGAPITTPDGITVIPVSRVSLGFGTGGTSGSKGVAFTGGNGGLNLFSNMKERGPEKVIAMVTLFSIVLFFLLVIIKLIVTQNA